MFTENDLTWDDVKKEPFIIEHILWEKEPKDLMEPRLTATAEGLQLRDEIKGYVFYIDTMDKKPGLFLMRHTAADYAETLAQIEEIPEELVTEAIEENKSRQYFGMYPINKKNEDWLKKELGVKQ